ncbi:MAG: transcription-repair coupling factor [Chloroflexota bacterium]
MTTDLGGLLPLIDKIAAYRELSARLKNRSSARAAVLSAAKPYLLAALYLELGGPMLVVLPDHEAARKTAEQIEAWLGTVPVYPLAPPDVLPYQRIAQDAATGMERLKTLSALAGNGKADRPPLVVTSAAALVHKLASFREFCAAGHNLSTGTTCELYGLLAKWQGIGYKLESVVEVPGTISHRGGIVDIFPPTSELPARLEFFGNIIDRISLFDPETQRSGKTVPRLFISPATELLALSHEKLARPGSRLDLSNLSDEVREQYRQEMEDLHAGSGTNIGFYAPLFNQDSLLGYLPAGTIVVLDEPASLRRAAGELDREAAELRDDKLKRHELPANYPRPYFTWSELLPGLESRTRLELSDWAVSGPEPGCALDFKMATSFAGQLPAFLNKLKTMLSRKSRVVIVSHQASRLSELLLDEDVLASPVAQVGAVPPPGSLTLVQGSLDKGWVMPGGTHLFTDAEIFGFVKQRRLSRKHPVPHHKLITEITPDDYVVHVEHGVGRFKGVVTLNANQAAREYLVIEYAEGDRLYVPTDQIGRVERYVGAHDHPPGLSRLGTQQWSRTTQKAREAAEEVARDLLALYAARMHKNGFAFSPPTVWQQEMEASFPYTETPDQLEVWQQVSEDMEKPVVMDRLVCGDVGYGKTEIALRAAFKAVMDAKQVAVLVPTTVLAEQHFATFRERFDTFPIRVEVLSRFRSEKEQRAILDDLARGKVDICLGTHRLLQKDVTFKDLGLVIIDEEQRFGVSHKEHFKKLRQEVDVLTLSATPIPRTLHMALAGARDFSTMETPPEQRLPVKTYVAEADDRFIREAVLREMERHGQAFFVHNRVQSIALVADKLRSLVPEAKIAVAHGQMPEAELEAVMAGFTRGESDVLVCTIIIESGLDLPNANTLIVNQADRFGLSQLYQLRGRVGRGANLAYAYFLYEKGKRLTPTAGKRLKTIFEATELGSGFNIALKDLEIRGAGNLLGTRQSGHTNAVGFNLYTRLLAEAVEELKAKGEGRPEKAARRLPEPTIDLPQAAYLPEHYVSDLDLRLQLYQRLARLSEPAQIEAFARELDDRFGTLPREAQNLLYALRIKLLAIGAGLESITTEDHQIVLRRFDGSNFDKGTLRAVTGEGVTIGFNQVRLGLKHLKNTWHKVLEEVLVRSQSLSM